MGRGFPVMAKKKKNRWGGSRPNSGRKPTGEPKKVVKFRLHPLCCEKVDEIIRGNEGSTFSSILHDAVQEYLESRSLLSAEGISKLNSLKSK